MDLEGKSEEYLRGRIYALETINERIMATLNYEKLKEPFYIEGNRFTFIGFLRNLGQVRYGERSPVGTSSTCAIEGFDGAINEFGVRYGVR